MSSDLFMTKKALNKVFECAVKMKKNGCGFVPVPVFNVDQYRQAMKMATDNIESKEQERKTLQSLNIC